MKEKQKSYWRNNLKFLTKISPSAFLVENLEKKDVKNLIENNFLPSKINLSAQNFYFFYCEKYVYGVFKPVAFRHDRTILENLTKYIRPIRLWGVSKNPRRVREICSNKEKLLHLLERENSLQKKLMLTVNQNEKNIAITFASEMLKQLIDHFEISALDKLDRLENLFKEIKSILAEDDSYHTEKDFEQLLVLGKELSNLLLRNDLYLREKIVDFNTILLYNPSCLPLSVVNYTLTDKEGQQQKIFPFINLSVRHSCGEEISHSLEEDEQKSNNVINSFAVIDLLEDSQSKVEVETIKKRQMLCRRQDISVSFLNQHGCDFESVFANNDFVHIIAHGKIKNDELCFYDESKEIFSTKDFQSFLNMPKVLFLSVCFSDEPKIISHFFKNKGQTIIVSNGRLFAHTLPLYLSSFYWQLFSARRSIDFAFHSILYKLFNDKQINAFRFKLYGEGKEFFISQKDFGEDPVFMNG